MRAVPQAIVRRRAAGTLDSAIRSSRRAERNSAGRGFLGRVVRSLPDDGARVRESGGAFEPRERLAKVDTEAEQALAARFGIRSIPTVILFRDGRRLRGQAGSMTNPQQIAAWVQSQ